MPAVTAVELHGNGTLAAPTPAATPQEPSAAAGTRIACVTLAAAPQLGFRPLG